MIGMVPGLVIGLAAFGCSIGMGMMLAVGYRGISIHAHIEQHERKLFTTIVMGLAIIESAAVYGFVIAVLLVNKI